MLAFMLLLSIELAGSLVSAFYRGYTVTMILLDIVYEVLQGPSHRVT